MNPRLRTTFIVGAVLLVLLVGSVFVLAPRCDRQVGDETDFPLFILAGQTVCGASAMLGGGAS